MRPEIRAADPRFGREPLHLGPPRGPTLDDVLMVVLATATLIGFLALIGLSSVSTASRLEAAIDRLAS